MRDDITLDEMRCEHLRTKGYGKIDDQTWVTAEQVDTYHLGTPAMQAAARAFLAKRPQRPGLFIRLLSRLLRP